MRKWVVVCLLGFVVACAEFGSSPKAASSAPVALAASAPVKQQTPVDFLEAGRKKEHVLDLEGARADYQAAYDADPNNPEAITALARLFAGLSNYDAADKLLIPARKAHPDEPLFWLASAGIARAQKRYGDALQDARRVLMRNQANVQALGLIALLYTDQGKYELAEVYAGDGLKLAPSSAELLTTLGYIYYKRGEQARALAEFETAAKAEGNTSAAQANIGFIALAHRDYALAKDALSEAVRLGRATKAVLAGECYAAQGLRNGKQAAGCFNQLLARLPNGDADAAGYYYTLGQVQQSMNKDNAAALAAYKRYVELKGASLPKTDKVFAVIKALEENAAPAGSKVDDQPKPVPSANRKPAASSGGPSVKAAS